MQQLDQRRDQKSVMAEAADASQHRRKLLIATCILLVAIVVLLVRNRDFWFGSEPTPVAATTQDNWNPSTPLVIPQTAATEAPALSPATPLAKAQKHVVVHATAQRSAGGSSIVETERQVLRPFNVQVVGGNKQAAASSNSTATANMASGEGPVVTPPVTEKDAKSPVVNTADRVRLTADTTYPLLGPQMRVQGSVLLQAIIGADGAVETLHVISGPTILAAAAREAVMHWRFKPYLENGRPVETQARVTVNFAIKVFDDQARLQNSGPASNGF